MLDAVVSLAFLGPTTACTTQDMAIKSTDALKATQGRRMMNRLCKVL